MRVVAAVVSTADSDEVVVNTTASTNHAQGRRFSSPNHPEIARNNIGDPSNVTGKRLTCFAIFLQRHYQQIRLDRLNEVRRSQSGIAADTADLNRYIRCAGRQNELLQRLFLGVLCVAIFAFPAPPD